MEFDKSRVFSAVNADELKIGSRVILGDSLSELIEAVEAETEAAIQNLMIIHGENMSFRFTGDKYHSGRLAYLIEPQAEQKYKPFSNMEKTVEIVKKHGGWVKDKKNNVQLLVVGFDDDNGFFLGNGYSCSYTGLFLDYVFADDDSPCGELVEE